MKDSKINWLGEHGYTANFFWGCQKVSAGCQNCYASALSHRYGKSLWGDPKTTTREIKKGIWKDIIKWDKEAGLAGERRRVFVSSMSDFLEDHPILTEPRERAKKIILDLKNLDVLMLTKRPENAQRFLADWYDDFPAHVWMMTTTENQKMFDKRVPELLKIPSKIHGLSVEPQLEMIYIPHTQLYEKIDWLVNGGESGAGCRTFNPDWARQLKYDAIAIGAKFWMKQLGGHPNPRHGLEDLPEDLRIRELPNC